MKRTQVNKSLKLQRKEIRVLQPPQLEHVVGGHGFNNNYQGQNEGGGGGSTSMWCRNW